MSKTMLITVVLASCLGGLGLSAANTGQIRMEGVTDLNISIIDDELVLSWSAVGDAIEYKVYSCGIPEGEFTEDPSGVFSGENWTAPVTEPTRFYYVTALIQPVPESFVYVPGGTYTMGDTHGGGFLDELPTHSVTLVPFFIGKYELTQAEYTAVMGSNPAHDYGVGDNYPVYYVSWYSIIKYCNLRSLAEGLVPCYTISGSVDPGDWGSVPDYNNATWNAAICDWSADGYRLPTEAEWEYAARGATNNPDYIYSGSDDVFAVAWHTGNPYSSQPVGTKAPNGIGTYDMSGNIIEWCWDWYSDTYYSISPSDNPTGPDSGTSRVVRNGSWCSGAFHCRVVHRDLYAPVSKSNLTGFRLCRSCP